MDSRGQRYIKRRDMLYTERTSWVEHWREIGYYISPRQFRYLLTDRNKGWKKNQFIINNTGTIALRRLGSGMMSGITSPARPWFRLTLADTDKAQFGAVRSWLDQVTKILLESFGKSNIYNCLNRCYEDLGGFGTTVLHVDDDFEDVLRGYVFPIGQYMLANSSRLEVDTVYRDFSMTAGQLVSAFGLENCSPRVQDAYKNARLDEWIEVVHIVEPNDDYEPGKFGQGNFRFRSCWLEKSLEAGDNKFLRESGYHEFPCMAPRWNVAAEDVYGHGPGMDCLGDIKALQQLERRKAQGVDKIVNPPMRAPSSMMAQRISMMPGDTNYVDSNAAGQTLAPAIEINPQAITVSEASIREHERRISAGFYEDLWLALSSSDNPSMTAREVAERHEEKMLQLGPVYERIENELLDPLVDRAIAIHIRAKKLPPPPPELKGQELTPEYISIMAQAQKLLATGGIERLTSFVGGLAGVKPEVLDKVDLDKAIDEYADSLGVNPDLVVPDDKVQELRAQRAQQQQEQAEIAKAQALAQGAATLSKADTSGDNALTRVAAALPQAAQGGIPGGA